MNFKNATFQKVISCLLVVCILSPAFVVFALPKKAQAIIPVADVANLAQLTIIAGNQIKDGVKTVKDIIKAILIELLKAIARKLIDKMTQATVNWINSGFRGKPLFIENPESFFGDIVKTEIKGFVGDIGYDKIKFPFGKDYALSLIEQTKSTFEQNAAYSLSNMYTASELEYQKNNLSAGGWNGFLINTQYPQNNLLGFNILANREIGERLTGPQSPVQKVKDKVSQGLGFLSQEKCKSNANWNPDKLRDGPIIRAFSPSPLPDKPPGSDPYTPAEISAWNAEQEALWNREKKSTEDNWKESYGCKEGPATVTPGSAISGQIMTALGSKQRQGELGAALGNGLSAIFDALINKLFSLGLTALSKALTAEDDPANTSINDFNYYGSATTGGTTGGGTGGTGGSTGGGYLGNPPTVDPEPKMIVNVNIVNDNGGILGQSGTEVYVDGSVAVIGVARTYANGAHSLSTNSPTDYSVTFGGDCASDGSITLELGSMKTCMVTFDDITGVIIGGGGGGGLPSTPRLTVNKIVINDNGGTLQADDVHLYVDGGLRFNGIEYPYSGGTHIVSEDSVPGYTGTIGGDCAPDGSITLVRNDVKVCTIINDDN
jgi:hypothetical protein